VLPALSACALRGPAFTGNARLEYNEAVQRSGREELLLNIVRLRYLEGPEFMAVGSVASQLRFDIGATVGGAFGDDQTLPTRLVTPGGSFGYSESPVTTFSPRQDQTFVRGLVEPVALETLLALTGYGWSLERALLVVVEEINGVRNVSSRESLATADVAAGERFAALARSLQALHERRWLTVDAVDEWQSVSAEIPAAGVSASDHISAAASGYRLAYAAAQAAYELQRPARRYLLKLASEARGSAEARAMLAELGLPDGGEYELVTAARPEDRGSGTIALRTRSVIGAMAYLSQGVAVPADDIAASRAEAGAVTVGVPLRIASASEEPGSAALAVRSGGRWFYIEAGDFDSRRTFGALESLVRLQVGAAAASGPVLTLPVAR
jgi:hypothetical protein